MGCKNLLNFMWNPINLHNCLHANVDEMHLYAFLPVQYSAWICEKVKLRVWPWNIDWFGSLGFLMPWNEMVIQGFNFSQNFFGNLLDLALAKIIKIHWIDLLGYLCMIPFLNYQSAPSLCPSLVISSIFFIHRLHPLV